MSHSVCCAQQSLEAAAYIICTKLSTPHCSCELVVVEAAVVCVVQTRAGESYLSPDRGLLSQSFFACCNHTQRRAELSCCEASHAHVIQAARRSGRSSRAGYTGCCWGSAPPRRSWRPSSRPPRRRSLQPLRLSRRLLRMPQRTAMRRPRLMARSLQTVFTRSRHQTMPVRHLKLRVYTLRSAFGTALKIARPNVTIPAHAKQQATRMFCARA